MPELEITPGGAERQIYLISTHLAKCEDWEVSICVGDYGQAEMVELEGVKLYRSISSDRGRVQQLPLLYACLKNIQADVYVFRTVDLGVAVGAFLVKLLGKKMVYMVANADEANPKALKSWFGSFRSAAMAWVYRNVDALMVQTDEQARDFKLYRGLEVKSKIPNLFIGEHVERDKPLIREIVLWVGRSDPLKRPHLFIEMARRFPQSQFVLISPATTYHEYSEKVKQLSREVDNLMLLERQNQEELMTWYAKAIVLVNTSVSEGFSNAMLEALYAEVPMLTMGVNPDGILDRFELGYTSKDEKEFDRHFERLIQDENLRKQMGQRGRNYVEKEHSPESALQKFKAVVDALC